MILDTSALLAIFLREPEAEQFAHSIEQAQVVRMSVASYLEAAMFVDRRGDEIRRAMLDIFLEEFAIQLEPITLKQAGFARQAYFSFGKGRHLASLNFGDCFTYALAKEWREPILFKGDDFSHTDIGLIYTFLN